MLEGRARMRIKRLEHGERILELVLGERGFPEERPDVLLGEEVRVAGEDFLRVPDGPGLVRELAELREQALLHGPGACPDGVKVLDALYDYGNLVRLDVCAVNSTAVLLIGEQLSCLLLVLLDEDLGSGLGDVVVALLQVAVVIDPVNDSSRYRLVAFSKRRERELPDQMLLESLLSMPLGFELIIVYEG